jgi:pyruvate/2-oxoglutarate/acetoin dehydrogenase E1 component
MSREVTYVEQLRNALHSIMEDDPTVVLLGEDILDPYGGAFKVTKGLSTHYPTRVFATPICEATIVGIGIGLALRGLRPIVEIMFGDFVTLATDQIINHAAKFHSMYNGGVEVPIVIRTPMGGGRGYGPTHSQSLERLFFGIPHIKILAPSHFHDPGKILRDAVADPEPIIFVENKLLYPEKLTFRHRTDTLQPEEANGIDRYPCIVLRNYCTSEKADVMIVAYGGVSRLLAPLHMRLIQEEIRILSCIPSCLSPCLVAPILELAKGIGKVIIVEESQTEFGWGAEVASQIYNEMHRELLAPIKRLGAANTVIPSSRTLEDEILVSEDDILLAILEMLKW